MNRAIQNLINALIWRARKEERAKDGPAQEFVVAAQNLNDTKRALEKRISAEISSIKVEMSNMEKVLRGKEM